MSIYRCNKCDLKKDNDFECVHVVIGKFICESCWEEKIKDNFCEICYEPINEIKRVCGMCADNRVKDGIWTEEEKNEKMYKEKK